MPEEHSDLEPPAPPGTPHRGRRTTLVVGLVGAIVAAAVAVVVVVAVQPAPQPQKYTSVPSPCALVTAATLAKYVSPEVSGVPILSGGAAGCSWSSAVGKDVRLLQARVDIYRSSSAVTDAERAYSVSLTVDCKCTVTTRSVTGLGDRAEAVVTTQTSTFAQTESIGAPGVELFVRSGNADIAVSYSVLAYAARTSASPLTTAARLAVMISAAHDVLDALADPAAAAPRPATITLQYAVPPHPCQLLTAATLTKYLNGPAVSDPDSSLPASSGAIKDCDWTELSGEPALSFDLSVFGSADGIVAAQVGPPFQARGASLAASSSPGVNTTETQPVTGVGNQAIAIFQTMGPAFNGRPPPQDVQLLVWSGNVDISIEYTYEAIIELPPPRTVQLSIAVATARAILAALPRSLPRPPHRTGAATQP